jgi:hypothetical protein
MQKVKPCAETCCHCSWGEEATGTVQGTVWAAWADPRAGVQAVKAASSRRRELRMVTQARGKVQRSRLTRVRRSPADAGQRSYGHTG